VANLIPHTFPVESDQDGVFKNSRLDDFSRQYIKIEPCIRSISTDMEYVRDDDSRSSIEWAFDLAAFSMPEQLPKSFHITAGRPSERD
jgi:hypothetical protein